MIPIFIGRDKTEDLAWHVLSHSIMRRSSEPVAITAIGNSTLPRHLWWRERGLHDSTDFSNARFAVPALMDYRGWAIFMDCDMVCLGDISELWEQRDERFAVQVVKHNHIPTTTHKFLGNEQARYSRKNWSSLMLINCAHASAERLTPDYINTAPGLDLHRFDWCWDEEIGSISGLWNVLVTDRLEHPETVDRDQVKLLHYTEGGAWHGIAKESEQWAVELHRLLGGANPCANVVMAIEPGLSFAASYKVLNEKTADSGGKANGFAEAFGNA